MTQHLVRFALISILLSSPALATQMFGDDYKPCGDQSSTEGSLSCVAAKTKILDKRLNANYAALLKSVQPAQQTSLRAAQRLWIQYRDANCAFYGSGEGSIRELNSAECTRAMTQDRAVEFEDAMKP